MKNWQKFMLRRKVEGEMVLLSEGSSVKESPEDKQACAPCVRGSAKISWRVTLALYTSFCLQRSPTLSSSTLIPNRKYNFKFL